MFTSKTTTMAAVLIVVVAILVTALHNTEAQSPVLAPTFAPQGVPSGTAAPGPALDCFSVLVNLSDCLTFVEEGSNLTVPDKACCPELAGLVDSNPICLCQLLGSGASSFGISIDLHKAFQLPSICGVNTPDPSLCSLVGVPVSLPSPSEAPGQMGGLSPEVGVLLSPEGGVLAPSSGNTGSGASNVAISGLSTLICFAIGYFGAFLLV